MASDLELDLLRFAVAFYARGCFPSSIGYQRSLHLCIVDRKIGRGKRELEWGLTGSIFSAADFDELLDIRDFFGHLGGSRTVK